MNPSERPRPGQLWKTDNPQWGTVKVLELYEDGGNRCMAVGGSMDGHHGLFNAPGESHCSYSLTERAS